MATAAAAAHTDPLQTTLLEADLLSYAPVHRTECAAVNAAFAKCKLETGGKNSPPQTCMPQGDAVTTCIVRVGARLEKSCAPALTAYKACLETNGALGPLKFARCQELADKIKACDVESRGEARP